MDEGMRIEKPITVAYEETSFKLANIINESGLPAFVVEAILTNIIKEVQTIRIEQYKKDKAAYDEIVSKEGKESKAE